MSVYVVHEFDKLTCEPTNQVFYFQGTCRSEVVHKVLAHAKLSDGNACIGPTGLVVHKRDRSYVVGEVTPSSEVDRPVDTLEGE